MKHVLIAILVASMCSACQTTHEQDNTEVQGQPTSTSAPEGGAEALKATASPDDSMATPQSRRLLTLGGSVTETVFALGHGDKVVGVDVSSVHPPTAIMLPKVGYYRKVSAEGVVSLKPDLVIASAATGPPDVVSQLEGMGIRLEKVPEAKTLAGAKARITAIAELLGEQVKGAELVKQIEADLSGLKPQGTPKKVLFIYARGAGTLNVAGAKTSADELIRLAGGVNAVSDYEGYKPMNSEAIVAAAPDVILLTTRGLKSVGGPDGVAKLEGVSLTPAAKTNAIIGIDDLKLLGFGPRVGQAATELAAALYGGQAESPTQ